MTNSGLESGTVFSDYKIRESEVGMILREVIGIRESGTLNGIPGQPCLCTGNWIFSDSFIRNLNFPDSSPEFCCPGFQSWIPVLKIPEPHQSAFLIVRTAVPPNSFINNLFFAFRKSVRQSFFSFYHLDIFCRRKQRRNIIATVSTSQLHNQNVIPKKPYIEIQPDNVTF